MDQREEDSLLLNAQWNIEKSKEFLEQHRLDRKLDDLLFGTSRDRLIESYRWLARSVPKRRYPNHSRDRR